MKRKIFNVFLIVVVSSMIVGILSGCDHSQNGIDNIDNVDVKETEELNPVELTFYMWGEEKRDTQEVLDKVDKATKLNIQLNFKWFSPAEYNKKVVSAIYSNESFDAFLCGKLEVGGFNIVEFYRTGHIKDISELIPQYAPEILEQLSKEELDGAKVDGRIVMIPKLSPMTNWLSVYIRKDLADKYEISSLGTLSDYEILMRKIKENEDNIIPGLVTEGTNYNINFLARAYGYVILDYTLFLVYKWDDPEMKIIPWEETPEFKETTSLISKWHIKGYVEKITGTEKGIASLLVLGSNIYEKPIEVDLFNNGNPELYDNYILYKDKKIQRYSPMRYGLKNNRAHLME